MFKKISLSALALGLMIPCSILAQEQSPVINISAQQTQRSGITTIAVKKLTLPSSAEEGIHLNGTVVLPSQSTEIVSTPLAGTVQALLVNAMHTVKTGQPIARLYSAAFLELQRGYVQLKSQHRVALNKLERDQALYKEGIISESRRFESLNLEIQARAALDERYQALKLAGLTDRQIESLSDIRNISPNLTVSAPRAGLVTEVSATLGQRLDTGTPLFKLADGHTLWVELQATRSQSQQLKTGDAVIIPACSKPGHIMTIDSQLNTAAQTVMIRAEIPATQQCIRPNQYLEAIIQSKSHPADALMIPSEAIVRYQGQSFVFAQSETGFRAVKVDVIRWHKDQAWVRGHLAIDQKIAVKGIATIKGAWLGIGSDAVTTSSGAK